MTHRSTFHTWLTNGLVTALVIGGFCTAIQAAVTAPWAVDPGDSGTVRKGETVRFFIGGSDDGLQSWQSEDPSQSGASARIWLGTEDGRWDVLQAVEMRWDPAERRFYHDVAIPGNYPQTYSCVMYVYSGDNQSDCNKDRRYGGDPSGRIYRMANTPPVAVNATGRDNQTTNNPSYLLAWRYGDADNQTQTHYQVQVSSELDFASIEQDSGERRSSSGGYVPRGLASGTWHWRVRVRDGHDWSAWSEPTSFRVDPFLAAEELGPAPELDPEVARDARLFWRARKIKSGDIWTHENTPAPDAIEMVEKREGFSRYFQHPDGAITFETHAALINYQDAAGVWHPIDLNLVPSKGPFAYENKTNTFETYFAAKADGFHRYNDRGFAIDFRLLDAAAAAPRVEDGTIAYPEVMEGVDLVYTVIEKKLNEDIILSRYTGRHRFDFEMKLPAGAGWEVGPGGKWVRFEDASGEQICRVGAPYMIDTKWLTMGEYAPEDSLSEAVTFEMAARPDGVVVFSVVADEEWLTDAARVYPVIIDPEFETARELYNWPVDTCVDTYYSGGTCNHGAWGLMRVGRWATGPSVWRGMLRFNHPSGMVNTDQVCWMYAWGKVEAAAGGGCYGHLWYRRGINDSWSEGGGLGAGGTCGSGVGATWNTTGGASHEGGPGAYTCVDTTADKAWEWSWNNWGPWINDTGYVFRADTEGSNDVLWTRRWYTSDWSAANAHFQRIRWDNQAPSISASGQGGESYSNNTTQSFSGSASDNGDGYCTRGLKRVLYRREGYNGTVSLTQVSGSGSSWSHNNSSINGHNLWYFKSEDNGTLQSGEVWVRRFVDSVAPNNPGFSSVTAASTSQIDLAWSIPTDRATGAPDGAAELRETSGSHRYRRGDVGVRVQRGSTGIYGWGAGTTHNDTGLSANTAYTYTIAARDNTGGGRGSWQNTTSYVGSTTKYTKIQAPTGLTFGTVAATSIQAAPAGTFSNLTAGSSGVRVSNATAGTNSGWVQNTNAWTSSGLTGNTVYNFSVESRNGNSVSSGTASGSKRTLAAAPAIGQNVASDQSTGTTYPAGTLFGFSNPAGFGDGSHGGNAYRVAQFKYAWNKSDSYSFTGSEANWNTGALSLAPGDGDGAYYLHLQSFNGDGVATATTLSYGPFEYDGTEPTVVSITPSTTGPTNADSVSFAVVFSEAVSGFDSSDDVAVQHSGTANTEVTIEAVSGTEYTVTVSGITGDGSLALSVVADAATDSAGNGNPAAGPSEAAVIDNSSPTVTVEQGAEQDDPTGLLPIVFDVVFSEPVDGFDETGVSMGGTAEGVVFAVSGSGTTYVVSVTAIDVAGTVQPSVTAGAIQDAAGNPNEASTSVDNSVLYAVAPPPSIVSWASVREHALEVGDMAIVLDADGSKDPVTEPRRFGLQKVEVVFDHPAQAADGTLDAEDVLVNGSSAAVTAVSLADGGLKLVIELTGLADGARHTIDLTGKFKGADAPYQMLVGDADCEVRCLEGDVNGDGVLNLIDVGATKTHLLAGITSATCVYDVNLDGRINVVDISMVMALYGNAAP
ncbi:MAG: hypothetical protein GXY55_07725 [Phycisphaerae bacterium]|nr:hypothetical protein [Phycisphaerae bacterium]